MGWIQDQLHRHSQAAGSSREGTETDFARAAQQRWHGLGEELRADVAEFNSHQAGAGFESSGNEYRVRNSASGLEVILTADFEAQTVQYEYKAMNNKRAGIPEGGMLSMRASRRGTVDFYSADERLTPEETRQVLLQPVLFPPELAA